MTLFGPILRYELVRAARRQRLTLLRCVYAAALLGAVAATYAALTHGGTVTPPPAVLARAVEGLFYGLFAAQFAVAAALTPQWAADAVTGEKERQTLPFLLATPLHSREIVLGKLAARLAQLGLFVLAGLPVLCFLQFLGGIDPQLVLAGYATLAATLVDLGALAVLCSVYSRTTRAAAQRTARVVGLYILALMVGGPALAHWPAAAAFPGSPSRPFPIDVLAVYELLDVGNPIGAVWRLAGGVRGGLPLDDVLWRTAGGYVLFHLTAAVVWAAWAVWRLRPVAASLGDGPPPQTKTGLFRPPARPPVGDRPVLWKAVHFDFRQYRSAIGRVMTRLVFLLSFTPLAVTLGFSYWYSFGPRVLAESMNVVMRGLVTAALSGLLLVLAGQAAGCIGRERQKRTLDDLLLTDLTTEEILGQKWWASIVVIRWVLVWVAVHWAVGLATGGLHPLAVPVLVLEWAAYAAFVLSLGVYWAARMPTARAAGVGTGLVGFAVAGLPVVAALLLLLWLGDPGEVVGVPLLFVSPPAAMGASAFTAQDLATWSRHARLVVPSSAAIAVSAVVLAVLGRRFWRGACWWFPRRVGRG
jgi:ABC-type Na+ efflux pump permease subunit